MPNHDDAMAGVAEHFLEMCRRGQQPSIQDLVQLHPELAREIEELYPTLELLQEAGAQVESGPPAMETPAIDRLGDFRVLREIGRGGMGVVYEALQESLGRRVALKVLPGNLGLDPRNLQRFKREVQAAAKLRHPNIVPVYEVGESDGVHYYAMQLIDGAGLDRVLEQLQSHPGEDVPDAIEEDSARTDVLVRALTQGKVGSPSGREGSGSGIARSADESDASSGLGSGTKYFRNAARVGLHAARALHEAHAEGVLHRDLKPSNLLLDRDGTVWVSDFGLAKAEGSDAITHSGDVLGTPRYLAPESLHGSSDPRTDVYGIGVTLYELLTLRPAFHDARRALLLRQIAEQEPTRPTRIDPRIPRDLETIVLTAMHKSPDRRYATAAELADDLARFLEGQPIQARRASFAYRASLFVRRHPLAVVGTTVGIALLLAVSVGWSISLEKSRQREEQARGQSDKSFQFARDAMRRMRAQFGLLTGTGFAPMDPESRTVLEDAASFYETFLDERGDDPELELEAAEAWSQLGQASVVLEDYQGAETSLRTAEELLRKFAAKDPALAGDARNDLAVVQLSLGSLRFYQGRMAEAERSTRDGLAAVGDPGVTDNLSLSVLPYVGGSELLGALLYATHRLDEAEAALERGVSTGARLQAAHPDNVAVKRSRVGCLLTRAQVLKEQGRAEDSLTSLDQASDLLRQLIEDLDGHPMDRFSLGQVEFHRGMTLGSFRRPEQRQAAFERSRKILDELVADYPEVHVYQSRRAEVLVHLGLHLLSRGAREESRVMTEEAIGRYDHLIADSPATVWRIQELAVAWISVGNERMHTGKLTESESAYLTAIDRLEGLRESLPEFAEYQLAVSSLALAYGNLGSCLEQQNRFEASEAKLRKSVALYAELRERNPGSLEYITKAMLFSDILSRYLRRTRRLEEAEALLMEALALGLEASRRTGGLGGEIEGLGGVRGQIALLRRWQGRHAEAEELLRKHVEYRRAHLDTEDARTIHMVGASLNNLALVLCDQGDYEESLEVAQQAIEWQKRALEKSEEYYFRVSLHFHYSCVAMALAGMGEVAEALKWSRLSRESANTSFFDVARILSICADEVEINAVDGLDPVSLRAEALVFLGRAVNRNTEPPLTPIEEDSAYTSLHGLDEFEELVDSFNRARERQSIGR